MKVSHVLIFAALFQFSHGCETDPDSSAILYGQNAKLGEFPHQLLLSVKLKDGRLKQCGAALINKMQALTAAHCVEDPHYYSYVKAGIISQYRYGQKAYVESFVMHQKWKGNANQGYDIAVLTFKTPLTFNKYVQPIAWNEDSNLNYVGTNCKISGWGYDEHNKGSLNLKKANMPVIDDDRCNRHMGGISYKNICVYNRVNGACYGDSGGPLTCCKDGRPLLVGISSYVVGEKFYVNNREIKTCNTSFPSVYAEVANYKDFISKHVHIY